MLCARRANGLLIRQLVSLMRCRRMNKLCNRYSSIRPAHCIDMFRYIAIYMMNHSYTIMGLVCLCSVYKIKGVGRSGAFRDYAAYSLCSTPFNLLLNRVSKSSPYIWTPHMNMISACLTARLSYRICSNSAPYIHLTRYTAANRRDWRMYVICGRLAIFTIHIILIIYVFWCTHHECAAKCVLLRPPLTIAVEMSGLPRIGCVAARDLDKMCLEDMFT